MDNHLYYMSIWLKKYELAKEYFKHHGNLEIPYLFKTSNGYDYDENGVFLGHWIFIYRQARKKNNKAIITDEQIRLLDSIGMRWNNITSFEKWQKKYDLARAYFDYFGNLGICQNFKTKNGVDFDENGIALGSWINTVRCAYKGNSSSIITEEQIHLLNEIGMIWDVNKNFEEVSEICLQNTISLEINKNILKRITSSMFQAKISFLKDNGLSLVDENGKLHEMFSMNPKHILEKYGVSIKDVIENYGSSTILQKKL